MILQDSILGGKRKNSNVQPMPLLRRAPSVQQQPAFPRNNISFRAMPASTGGKSYLEIISSISSSLSDSAGVVRNDLEIISSISSSLSDSAGVVRNGAGDVGRPVGGVLGPTD